jgi:hypothetical protein
MNWSKFCRIFNLTACILFGLSWIVFGCIQIFISKEYNESLLISIVMFWMSMAFWEKGTISRIRGKVNDQTMVGK